MADEAARICLKATGSQDEYLLSKKPEDSPFFYDGKSIRHADFRKYHRNVNVTNPGAKPTWPFGETIKITFNPSNMGDLLSNMWVSIELPGIANGNYADAVGRHIFERVTMYVDELEVETFYDGRWRERCERRLPARRRARGGDVLRRLGYHLR